MLAKAGGIEYMPWNVSMADSVHPSGSGYGARASKLARLIGRLVRPGTSEGDDTSGGRPLRRYQVARRQEADPLLGPRLRRR